MKLRILALSAVLALAACNTTPGATPLQDVTQVLQTIQPIESTLACAAQQGCNQATAVATIAGSTADANNAQLCSIVAGTFCNGLPAGATLPVPVPVSGTTAVPTPTGPVVLPVPAVKSAPAS
jgi:predicted small secreted protein